MKSRLLVYLSSAIIAGCASVDFNDAEGKDKGFLYYPPKPFLLVEKKDKVLISKIISIPDTENPKWIKQGEGWGSSEMSFEIENGMVKTFNSKSDNKGAETLASIAGIATAKAAIETVDASIKIATIKDDDPLGIATVESCEVADDKSNTVTDINGAETYIYKLELFRESCVALRAKVLAPMKSRPNQFKDEIQIIEQSIALLEMRYKTSFEISQMDKFIDNIEKQRDTSKLIAGQLNIVFSTLDFYSKNEVEKANLITFSTEVKAALDEVAKKLVGFSERSSSITGLYEIRFIDGKLKLTKVTIGI